MVWYYQFTPGETHDIDDAFENVLIDHGGRSSLFKMGKLGILWELDRKTGKFVAAHDLCREFEATRLPVRCVFIDVIDNSTLIPLQGIDAAYIAPLRAVNVEALVGLFRAKHIRTVTAVDEYILTGAAVGLALRGDHAEIVVNLPGSRAEGADFSSQLLRLARIVQ